MQYDILLRFPLSLRPIKCGMELVVRGYSGKVDVFVGQILSTLFDADVARDKERFERVFEVHRKGVESGEADSLKCQAKHLLCNLLCPRTFSR